MTDRQDTDRRHKMMAYMDGKKKPSTDPETVEALAKRLSAVVPYQGKSNIPFMCHEAAATLRSLLAENAKLRTDMTALVEAAKGMKCIIEGIDGAMNYGTWRSDRTNLRIKDTPEWVALYNAIAQWEASNAV